MAVEIYVLAVVNYWKVGLSGLRYGRAMLYRLVDEEGILGEFGGNFGQAMAYETFERCHMECRARLLDHNTIYCTEMN